MQRHIPTQQYAPDSITRRSSHLLHTLNASYGTTRGNCIKTVRISTSAAIVASKSIFFFGYESFGFYSIVFIFFGIFRLLGAKYRESQYNVNFSTCFG